MEKRFNFYDSVQPLVAFSLAWVRGPSANIDASNYADLRDRTGRITYSALSPNEPHFAFLGTDLNVWLCAARANYPSYSFLSFFSSIGSGPSSHAVGLLFLPYKQVNKGWLAIAKNGGGRIHARLQH